MSTAGDIFTVIKRIMLVSEDLARLTAEMKEMSEELDDHDRRLIRIETTLALSSKGNRIILPGS